jgi:hypothetical protein
VSINSKNQSAFTSKEESDQYRTFNITQYPLKIELRHLLWYWLVKYQGLLIAVNGSVEIFRQMISQLDLRLGCFPPHIQIRASCSQGHADEYDHAGPTRPFCKAHVANRSTK